jgi:hypothetical protein
LHDAVLRIQLTNSGVERRRVLSDEWIRELVDEREQQITEEPEEQGADDDHRKINKGRSQTLARLAGDESVDDAEYEEQRHQRGGQAEHRFLNCRCVLDRTTGGERWADDFEEGYECFGYFADGVGEEPGDPFDDLLEHCVGNINDCVLKRGYDISGCWDADWSDTNIGEDAHR